MASHQRDGLLGEEQTAVPLVAVRVSAEGPAPASSAEGRPGLIEIELPGGVRLRVHGMVEAAALRQVLAALRSR